VLVKHRLIVTTPEKVVTFETVMSSEDKVAFMLKAKASGYRTYLYFVATEDPDININRVKNRVAAGGHPVPTEKIVQRYGRCLNLLPAAIAASNRAYIFDNSGADLVSHHRLHPSSALRLNCNSASAFPWLTSCAR
jgi:predicted ABC-type ATPase